MRTSQPRTGLAFKLTFAAMALVALVAVTTMVVHDVPFLEDLEEEESVLSAQETATVPGGLFAALTTPEPQQDAMVQSVTAVPIPAQEVVTGGFDVVNREQLMSAGNGGQSPAARACVRRGPPVCKLLKQKCVKHGPVCGYKKMCVRRANTCIKHGKCAQSGKRCHYTFSKKCIACAKKTKICWHAHSVATTCVKTCATKCFKDAGCERRCAQGCLKRYQGYIRRCKQECTPCKKGTSEKCWNACYEWKTCKNPKKVCHRVDQCIKRGKSCSFKKTCVKWGKACSKKKKCALFTKSCTSKSKCVRRDSRCSHPRLPACKVCRSKVKPCLGYDRVKSHCNADCTKKCGKAQSKFANTCRKSCFAGCRKTEAVLKGYCVQKCPICTHRSPSCHLKCVKKQTTKHCKKLCKKTKMVPTCKKVCKKKQVQRHCIGSCAKWKATQVCHTSCSKWQYSKTQPCRHPCATHGFKHSCSKKKRHCVQWTGGKSCKHGPCLRYEVVAPVKKGQSAKKLPLAPGPVMPSKAAAKKFKKSAAKTVKAAMPGAPKKATVAKAKAEVASGINSKAAAKVLKAKAEAKAAAAKLLAQKKAIAEAKAKAAKKKEVASKASVKEKGAKAKAKAAKKKAEKKAKKEKQAKKKKAAAEKKKKAATTEKKKKKAAKKLKIEKEKAAKAKEKKAKAKKAAAEKKLKKEKSTKQVKEKEVKAKAAKVAKELTVKARAVRKAKEASAKKKAAAAKQQAKKAAAKAAPAPAAATTANGKAAMAKVVATKAAVGKAAAEFSAAKKRADGLAKVVATKSAVAKAAAELDAAKKKASSTAAKAKEAAAKHKAATAAGKTPVAPAKVKQTKVAAKIAAANAAAAKLASAAAAARKAKLVAKLTAAKAKAAKAKAAPTKAAPAKSVPKGSKPAKVQKLVAAGTTDVKRMLGVSADAVPVAAPSTTPAAANPSSFMGTTAAVGMTPAFAKVLAEAHQQEQKAEVAGQTALANAKVDEQKKFAMQQPAAQSSLLKAKHAAAVAAVAAASKAQASLEAAKAQLAAMEGKLNMPGTPAPAAVPAPAAPAVVAPAVAAPAVAAQVKKKTGPALHKAMSSKAPDTFKPATSTTLKPLPASKISVPPPTAPAKTPEIVVPPVHGTVPLHKQFKKMWSKENQMPLSALQQRLNQLMKAKLAAEKHAQAAVAAKFLAKSKMAHAHDKASKASFQTASASAAQALLTAQRTEEAYMEAKLQLAAAKKPQKHAPATQLAAAPIAQAAAAPAAPIVGMIQEADSAQDSNAPILPSRLQIQNSVEPVVDRMDFAQADTGAEVQAAMRRFETAVSAGAMANPVVPMPPIDGMGGY